MPYPHVPRRSYLALPALAALLTLGLAPAPAAAQGGLVLTQKSTHSIARVGSGDLQQTMMLRDDRMKVQTQGRMRFLVFNRDASGTEIVRLDEGHIYSLDDRRRQYDVLSMDEMRAQIQQSQREAQGAATEAREDEEIRYSVVSEGFRKTGERQTINGFSTEQGVLKLTVVGQNTRTGEKGELFHMTADFWIDPSQRAAGQAMQRFYTNYAQRLGVDPRTAGNPYARWLGELYKDMDKMEGLAIRSTITLELATQEGAAQQTREQPAAAPARDPVGAAVGGLMRRAQRGNQQQAPGGSGRPVLFNTTTEVLTIALSAPELAEFEVPQGYRKK